MDVNIPYDRWQPLSPIDIVQLFATAPFRWCLAGGYAIEQFLGTPIREHADIDVMIYRDEQLSAQRWLHTWQLFAADPPGTLRPWADHEYLPRGIHDIWGHRQDVRAWELQIMLAEVEVGQWFMRGNPQVRGHRDDLITTYAGIPCVRVEVQLLYKARRNRPKDMCDFQACVPRLAPDAKRWLRDQLRLLYPTGHAWLEDLD